MSNTLPKEQLLLKLLKKTQADHDGETLIAIRMANKLLADAGWDWEKLLAGKITVVEDPFKSLTDPGRPTHTPNRQQAPGRPTPTRAGPPPFDLDQHGWGPVFQTSPPPRQAPPPPQPVSTTIKGVSINRFPGFCWSCAKEVIAGNGSIFKPRTHNIRGPDKFEVVCGSCDGTQVCQSNRAIATGKRKRSVGDLA
jgi:hypothetical protein